MSVRRLAAVLLLSLLAQGSLFAWMYGDLVYLRLPRASLVGNGPATFARHATEALERPSLTRGHLDTIADMAQTFRRAHLEVTARERRLTLDPTDRALKLRFAEALRRQGDRVRAERLFLELVEAEP
jgi:hypothetical protein